MDDFTREDLHDEDERPSSKPNGAGGPHSRLQLVPWEEIRLGTQRHYVVKGLIPRVGLTVIWGPPKCGKSFWTFDLLMHSALGWNYRGRRTHSGPVVYCAFEGQEGFKGRKEAFRQRFLQGHSGPVPFYLLPVTLDLVADHRDLIAAIRYTLGEIPPCAVGLDTLNRSLRGSESSDEDMGAYIKAADAIRAEFDCAVPIVHHCGVDGTRPRGHTSLTGAVEAQIAVRRDTAENVVATVEWMKDGPEDATIVSRLEQVEVGTDEDGEPITSCVVEPVDETGAEATSTAARWPRALVFYHRALTAALDAFGQDALPFADGPRVRAVNREHVRAEFKRVYPVDGDTEAKKGDALRKAFKRAESDALARDLIVCREVGDTMLVWTTA